MELSFSQSSTVCNDEHGLLDDSPSSSLQIVETACTSGFTSDGQLAWHTLESCPDIQVHLSRLQILLAELSSPTAIASAAAACLMARRPPGFIAVSLYPFVGGPSQDVEEGDSFRKRGMLRDRGTVGMQNVVLESLGRRFDIALSEDVAHLTLCLQQGLLLLDAEQRRLLCIPIRAGQACLGLVHVYYDNASSKLPTKHLQFCMAVSELLGACLRQRKRDSKIRIASSGRPVSLAELEEQHIRRVLAFTGGSKQKTASLLGIDRSTLHRKMEKYERKVTSLTGRRSERCNPLKPQGFMAGLSQYLQKSDS
ncbi:MAG: helix-turn-helix domain-containing protein [bacterium]|nr:helix-turn-helix domain-containing protein [bacterium]